MGLGNFKDQQVKCEFKIDNETFPIHLAKLFNYKDESLFSYFRQAPLNQIDTVDSPGEWFMYSTTIFNNNFIVKIESQNKILVSPSAYPHDYIITLTK